jgi:uncharacterized protein YegP (UPF0339 family)
MKAYKLIFKQHRITRQWRWKIVADNGKVVAASSESFWRKKGCEDNAKLTGKSITKHFENGTA